MKIILQKNRYIFSECIDIIIKQWYIICVITIISW